MKNSVINAASELLKKVNTDLRSANKEYTSISRVLKDIQRADMLKAGYMAVFTGLGFDPKIEKVDPATFFASLEPEQWGQTYNKAGDKVGEPWVGVWGVAKVKDAEGNYVKEVVNGVEVIKTEPKLRKVTAWSPTKFFKVYSQALAIKADKKSAK